MFPTTPPAVDLSRSRLKALAVWIRDELDPRVAREGPDSLKPNDVLTLHETFIQLRRCNSITGLDLRATGIHRAIQDIAGVATRWPSRLCDDCDKIISLWKTKFGPINELNPFLYGRGGRLEGIASVAEYSHEALLERWSQICPDKLQPKRSHRIGDIGFRAGDWWINTLFAVHAGIIGLEAAEGGTTFDQNGAYAMVLKDTGEMEAFSGDTFSYRASREDRGKFRLTAGTSRSRHVIRVLRSHGINSIWGPKAGVRYEGLYKVTGWSIRTAKTTDAIGGEWEEGDIIYEIRFQRTDPIPMEEVIKRPTATEIDDYAEFKRLRKVYRDGRRRAQVALGQSPMIEMQLTKVAPVIQPPATVPKKAQKDSTGPSRKPTFRQPPFDTTAAQSHEHVETVSPKAIPHPDRCLLVPEQSAAPTTPTQVRIRTVNDSPAKSSPSSLAVTAESSLTDDSDQSRIREVAPWIDYEVVPAPHVEDEIRPSRFSRISQELGAVERKRSSPSFAAKLRTRKSSDGIKKMTPHLNTHSSKGKDVRKPTFARTKNPVAKLFDGVSSDEGEDYFRDAMAKQLKTMQDEQLSKTLYTGRHRRFSTSEGTPHVHSPMPRRPFSPDSPISITSRNALFDHNPLSTRAADSEDDPFISTAPRRLSSPMPMPFKFLILPPPTEPMAGNSAETSMLIMENDDAVVEQALKKTMKDADARVHFSDPFSGSPERSRMRGNSGSDVAPDMAP